MNAQAKKEEVLLPAPMPQTGMALTPMDMLDRAITQGAGIEVLTKLMDLQERWDRNQNRKAFDEAVASAKAEIKPVVRNATGHNSKKYADFAALAMAVDPIISKFGLSYRFRTAQTDKIAVTCILSHKSGHFEETTLAGPADTTGNKNAIQAIGSTLTYLQRYSLVQALGLAASNDDDGKVAGIGDLISEQQAAQLEKLIASAGRSVAKFCEFAKIENLAELPANRFEPAVTLLKQAIAKQEKQQ